jgi:hypothetical protein
MQLKSKVLVGVSALGLAAGGGGAALATSGTAAANGAPDQQAFLQDVAKRLGVSESALEEALKGAAIDQVDGAVAAGRLTKEEGDRIKARIQSTNGIPFFGIGPGPGFGHVHLALDEVFTAAANYLGVSVDTLRSDLESGQSLADVTSAAGKSVDGLKSAIVAAVQKRLDVDVAAGRLTAAQANAMLDKLSSHLDELVNATPSVHRAFGMRGVGVGA